MEAFAQADTIIFDKTGTLTEACPKVSGILPFGSYSEEEILKNLKFIKSGDTDSLIRNLQH